MTSPIRNRRGPIDEEDQCRVIYKNELILINKNDYYLESISVVTINQTSKTDLLIIFLELLKHCVELFLLLGRNKLWASPQRIADQSELR